MSTLQPAIVQIKLRAFMGKMVVDVDAAMRGAFVRCATETPFNLTLEARP